MANAIKHLVKCRCVLHQYKNVKDPPLHQFIVTTKFDLMGSPVVKYAECNNCGAIHRVIDILKSEILNKDESKSIRSIEDIKSGLNSKLCEVLERYAVDLSTWEIVEDIVESEEWGKVAILSSEENAGSVSGKYLKVLSSAVFRVESYEREEIV